MRQSGVKHISCFYNSRRLDESWPHILDVANARRRTSRNLTLEDCEGDDELFGVMKTMLQSNASFLVFRNKYLGVAPWSLSRASTPEGARKYLEQVRRQPLEAHDLVTQGHMIRLEDHLTTLANGGAMHPDLDEEVKFVNLSALDESPGEGFHRSSNHEKTRSPASSSRHLKQEVRLKKTCEQIKQFRLKYGARGDDVLRHDWLTWKRLLQVKRSKRWVPVRMTDKKFLARVYRQDKMAEENWAVVLQKDEALGKSHLEPLTNSLEALNNEYMVAMVTLGDHYVVQVDTSRIGEGGEVVREVETKYFHLLQIAYGKARPKVMPIVDSEANLQMEAPLAFEVIFESQAQAHIGASDVDMTHLYSETDLVWVRPHDIAPFLKFQKMQRFRTVKASSVVGCLVVSDAERARPPQAILDKDCPTLAVILHLGRNGWRSVSSLVEHRDTDQESYDGSSAHSKKPYFQVLASLDRCLPLTDHIPSRQPLSFYKCLLAGKRVDPHQGDKAYTLALKDAELVESLAGLALEDEAVDSDNSDGVMLPLPKPPVVDKPKPLPGPLLSLPAPPSAVVPPASEPVPGELEAVAPENGVLLGPAVSAPKATAKERDWIDSLLGAKVAYHCYIQNDGTEYKNFILKCPCALHGSNCKKSKASTGKLVDTLGRAGPLAFLHAWISLEPEHGKSHARLNPTLESTRAFLEEHRQELEDLADRLTL